MYCKNCGALLDNEAKFCANCGSHINPGNSAQPESQEQAPDEIINPDVHEHSKLNAKALLLLLVPIAIIIIIVLILLFVFVFDDHGADEPTDAVEEYIESMADADAEDMLEAVPEDYIDDILEEYDMNEKELIKALEDYFEDWTGIASDRTPYDLTDIDETEVRFKKDKAYSNKQLKNFKNNMDKYYDISGENFDVQNITNASKMSMIATYFDKYGDKLQRIEESDVIAFKYDGDWYSFNAVTLIKTVAEEY